MAYGFIGPAIKKFLVDRGYSIKRPTQIEKSYTRSLWQQWFSRDPALLAEVYSKNRETLRSIPEWATNETLERSLWRYGVPVTLTSPIAGSVGRIPLKEIESEITSPDLLAFIARHCLPNLSYLEIGVSVGKTLLQMNYQLRKAFLTGIDLEEINPIILQHFDTCEEIWRGDSAYLVDTLSKGRVNKIPTSRRLTSHVTENTLEYVSADQFKDATWARLRGRRFNLIFSDGVHTADALRAELQFLIKYDLLNRDSLVMLWDDLHHPEMQEAFLENAKTLSGIYNRGNEAIAFYHIRGSYSDYDDEGRSITRPMGMFSSVP